MVLLSSLLAMCRDRLHKHLHTRYVWEEKLSYPERWLSLDTFVGVVVGVTLFLGEPILNFYTNFILNS